MSKNCMKLRTFLDSYDYILCLFHIYSYINKTVELDLKKIIYSHLFKHALMLMTDILFTFVVHVLLLAKETPLSMVT